LKVLLFCLNACEKSSLKAYANIFKKIFIHKSGIEAVEIGKLIHKDKNFIYKSDEAEKAMIYFHRRWRGKLKDDRICHQLEEILLKKNIAHDIVISAYFFTLITK